MARRTETTETVRHVDIVKNEWLAGFQVVVARLEPEGGKLRLQAEDLDKWKPIVLRPFFDRDLGREIGPDRAEDFFSRLHEHMSGDYVFATEPHEEKDCRFRDHLVVPIISEPARQLEMA